VFKVSPWRTRKNEKRAFAADRGANILTDGGSRYGPKRTGKGVGKKRTDGERRGATELKLYGGAALGVNVSALGETGEGSYERGSTGRKGKEIGRRVRIFLTRKREERTSSSRIPYGPRRQMGKSGEEAGTTWNWETCLTLLVMPNGEAGFNGGRW